MKTVCVIRSNGERTVEPCARLIRQQIDAELIEIRPFTAAVKRCYEIGIQSGADWLLTVDADVLAHDGAVERMMNCAKDMPSNVFMFEGQIFDKLSGSLRAAGHRMYRVALLDQAIPLIEEAVRVESSVVKKMRRLGFVPTNVDVEFGIHDYEQYYRDLYRKASVHAIKHSRWRPMVSQWRRSEDLDLRCARQGWFGLSWNYPEKEPLPAGWMPSRPS